MNSEKYFASCSHGLEVILEQDLKAQAIADFTKKRGGMEFTANPGQVMSLILNSRVANRVMKQLTSFLIEDSNDIQKKAGGFNWSQVMDVHQSFKIKTLLDHTSKSHFKNSLYLSQLLKDSIVDRFRQECGRRPSVNLKEPDLSFYLRVEKQQGPKFQASVMLDLCGNPLNMRGYRSKTQMAPLREDLAAGIIQLIDWNPKGDIFIDSMCGSGTLLIEAVLYALKIPPSYLRVRKFVEEEKVIYAFLRHKWFAPYLEKFKILAQENYNLSMNLLSHIPPNQFYGIDVSMDSIDTIEENLRAARFPMDRINISLADATTISPPAKPPGVVICNPPYGERMGEFEQLKSIYYNYGENLKQNFTGYNAYIFTSSAELMKCIALKTSQKIPLFNGDIDCRLVKYQLF